MSYDTDSHTISTDFQIAIIDPNGLSALGLNIILQEVFPQQLPIEVRTFSSFRELVDDTPDAYVHYFAASQVIIDHATFFLERVHKTIALVTRADAGTMSKSGFRALNIEQRKDDIVRSLLQMYMMGPHAEVVPKASPVDELLSEREKQVLCLVVKGVKNREIAEMLCISMLTVATHRKNITKKLGIKSVSGLTIFAVTNGLVEAGEI